MTKIEYKKYLHKFNNVLKHTKKYVYKIKKVWPAYKSNWKNIAPNLSKISRLIREYIRYLLIIS